jgi:hypothetical protein
MVIVAYFWDVMRDSILLEEEPGAGRFFTYSFESYNSRKKKD